MTLTKEQYDKLMLEYSGKRDRHRHELLLRKEQVYARIPEYRELEAMVPELSMQSLEDRLNGKESSDSLSGKLAEIAARKKELLKKGGYPEDYLEMQYDCPDCKDTGYIRNEKCHCLRQREVRILYRQSHLDNLLSSNRFELLRTSYYKGEDLEHFQNALKSCRDFIRNFDSDYENLFFYGTVGTGKSFLSICTAGELLKTGHTVLYYSSSGLFESISSLMFGQERREQYRSFMNDLYGCDLLIIDDLGTEMTNNFVSAQLFSLLNERDLNQKSTIISTNLALPELRDRYSDRIFSRITSRYIIRKLTGPDIRITKKVEQHTSQHNTIQKGPHGTNQTA